MARGLIPRLQVGRTKYPQSWPKCTTNTSFPSPHPRNSAFAIDLKVLSSVAAGDRLLFVGDAVEQKVMPVEFSTGAYRLMHSRARGRYRLNDQTDGSTIDAPLVRFFDVGLDEPNLIGGSPLPDQLVVDWDRMFIDPDQDLNITEVARILVSLILRKSAFGVVEIKRRDYDWRDPERSRTRFGSGRNAFPPFLWNHHNSCILYVEIFSYRWWGYCCVEEGLHSL